MNGINALTVYVDAYMAYVTVAYSGSPKWEYTNCNSKRVKTEHYVCQKVYLGTQRWFISTIKEIANSTIDTSNIQELS